MTCVAILAFGAYRLAELTRYPLWYDEIFSVTLAQMDWGEMFAAIVRDRTNPPLFYMLLKLWIGVGGTSVAWLRLLPCLTGIAVAIPVAALARRFANDSQKVLVGSVALAEGAASPLAVFLSNELRAYSLLLFLAATSMVAFDRVAQSCEWMAPENEPVESPSWWPHAREEYLRRVVQLGFVNLLLVYTHYFGWLIVGAQIVAAYFWARPPAFRHTSFAALVVGVLFAPWALTVALASRGVASPLANVDWITAPTPADVARFYDALVARVPTPATAWIGAVVMIAVVGFVALKTFSQRSAPIGADQRPSRLLVVVALMPVAVVFIASTLGARALFVPRYLLIVAPAWWVVIACGAVAAFRSPRAQRAAAVGFAAFTLACGAAREWRGGEKIRWDTLMAATAADAGPRGGPVYSLEGFTALPAAWYAAEQRVPLRVRPVTSLDSIAAPAWLVVRSTNGSTPGIGSGLAPNGLTLAPVAADTIPSHTITVYRVSR